MLHRSGQPGSAGTIVIRVTTVNGSTDPSWVIDGVIVGSSPGSLNPADIESMTILKDAASTAIYGSQGANGVIVVTTKILQQIRMLLSAKAGITNLYKGNLQVMNGQELYDYYSSFSNKEEIVFQDGILELRNANFDWWILPQTGKIQEYNLSLSGGSQSSFAHWFQLVYIKRRVLLRVEYTRYNLLYKTDYRPADWITIKPFISGSRRISTTVSILFLQCTQLYHGTALLMKRKYCRSLF